MEQNRLSLNDVEWGEFFVKDIFKIEKCKCSKVSSLSPGNVPYIGATNRNNGVLSFVNNNSKLITKGNCIAFICDGEGSIGYSIYKSEDFIGSTTVKVGRNNKLNKYNAQFITTISDKVRDKYNFGFKRNEKHLKKEILQLPLDNLGNPNWQFMEDYIKQEQKIIAQKVISYYEQKMLETAFDLVGLEDVEWNEFNFNDVFRKIQRGKRLKKDDHIEGNTPYISSTSLNNGLDQFIGNKEKIRKFKNNITLANSGSVGSCFYHEYEYIASDHVTSLTLDKADKYTYMFMSTIIKRLEKKYSFNREINDKRIRNEKFILPVDKNGSPHWKYMSEFMKKIESENLERVLEYIYIYKLAICCESKIVSLNEKEWKEFWLEDTVDIKSGQDIYQRERITGNIPYITATAQNNGIGYFVDNHNKTLEEKAISVNRNGSVGYAFYHNYRALYGNDTRKLIPKYRNKYFSLFLTSVITEQKEKYGYGYKMGTGRLKRQKILLPITDLGDVDFDYIKKFMQIEEIKHYYNLIRYYKNY
ncbi:MAG: restriction endonuclease subunit S [Finegoldia magna]|nr:restriction endonuclease subunit S [Finegoldia magna]